MGNVFDLLDEEWRRLGTDRGSAAGASGTCARPPVGRRRSPTSSATSARPTRRAPTGCCSRSWSGRSGTARSRPGCSCSCCCPGPGRWPAAGGRSATPTSGPPPPSPPCTTASATTRSSDGRDGWRRTCCWTPPTSCGGRSPRSWPPPRPTRRPRPRRRTVARRPVHAPTAHPAVELTEVLADAVAAGIVDRGDAELIARSRIGGQRVADIAVHRGLRPRTLWDRRQRAELALASARLAG